MKRTIILIAAVCCMMSCTDNNAPDTRKGGDTQTNQPANPSTWSPVGHVYICETTWENSPAADRYWAWVIKFYSERDVVEYETPNRDLSYHPDFLNTIDSTTYRSEYPILKYNSPAVSGYIDMVFKDTLTLRWEANNVTYTLLR